MSEPLDAMLPEGSEDGFRAERMRLLGELTAGLCHEMSQPISAIANFAAACAALAAGDAPPREEVGEYLDEITAQADRAAEILHRLRRFTRANPAAEAACDAHAAARDAIDFLAPDFRRQKITVQLLPDPGGANAAIDHGELVQALLYVLRDSLASLSAGDPQSAIVVHVDGGGAEVQVSVAGPECQIANSAGIGSKVDLNQARAIVASRQGRLVSSLSEKGRRRQVIWLPKSEN